MNKGTKWTIIVLLCAALGFGVYKIFFSKPTATNTDNKKQPSVAASSARGGGKPLNVAGIIIKPETISDEIYVNGRLMPDDEVDLSFETSGKIVKIYFTESTYVRKGQLLAKINDEPLQAQLQKLMAQQKLAEDRVARQSTLLLKDAISKESFEQVKTELATINADIELVKANIRQTELRAPFDGVLGLRQLSEGAYASPSTIIVKLTKYAPLKIDFSVNEAYIANIKKGTKLSFNVDGDLNTYNAVVDATESRVDAETFSLTVRALYANSRHELAAGRYAKIRLAMKEIENAIVIPSESIIPEMGVDKVFLYKSGKAQPAEITKGLRTADKVQVVDGLNIGDTLIITGMLQLRMGMPVIIDIAE